MIVVGGIVVWTKRDDVVAIVSRVVFVSDVHGRSSSVLLLVNFPVEYFFVHAGDNDDDGGGRKKGKDDEVAVTKGIEGPLMQLRDIETPTKTTFTLAHRRRAYDADMDLPQFSGGPGGGRAASSLSHRVPIIFRRLHRFQQMVSTPTLALNLAEVSSRTLSWRPGS